MRKAILCATMALTLTGIASALPAGPGGTFYFTGIFNSNTQYSIAYLNVNSAWAPVGGATQLSTISVVGYTAQSAQPAGITEGWYNASGRVEETAYNSATLFAHIRYDNIIDTESTTGTNVNGRGFDIIALDSTPGTPGMTLLNGGWDDAGTAATNFGTVEGNYYGTQVVDSGFTPNGETTGFYLQNGYNQTIWTIDSSGDGDYNEHTIVSPSWGGPVGIAIYQNGKAAYSGRLNGTGTVDFGLGSGAQAVTGAMMTRVPTQTNKPWVFTYKIAGGGYGQVLRYNSDGYDDPSASYVNGDFIGFGDASRGIMAGDTDNDGVMDVYYNAQPYCIHAEDKNGDGDIMDQFECTNLTANLNYFTSYLSDAALVMLPETFANGNNKWAIMFLNRNEGTEPAIQVWLQVAFLNSNGDYDASLGITTIDSVTVNSSGDTTSGDSTMAFLRGYYNGFFVPMAIPEPGTLMLVGTGVLGLAGVLRRRFLS